MRLPNRSEFKIETFHNGQVRATYDDLWVDGRTADEAVSNWYATYNRPVLERKGTAAVYHPQTLPVENGGR